jgi:hypothetical protein
MLEESSSSLQCSISGGLNSPHLAKRTDTSQGPLRAEESAAILWTGHRARTAASQCRRVLKATDGHVVGRSAWFCVSTWVALVVGPCLTSVAVSVTIGGTVGRLPIRETMRQPGIRSLLRPLTESYRRVANAVSQANRTAAPLTAPRALVPSVSEPISLCGEPAWTVRVHSTRCAGHRRHCRSTL